MAHEIDTCWLVNAHSRTGICARAGIETNFVVRAWELYYSQRSSSIHEGKAGALVR